MTDRFTVRTPRGDELDKVQQLRHAVLDPARLVPSDDRLTSEDHEDGVIHMAGFSHEKVVATVRFDLIDTEQGSYEVRKMATDPTVRKCGVGQLVMRAAMEAALQRGASEFVLDAREAAIPLFESLGFELTGEKIVHEDGVPNFVMRRRA